MPAEPRARAETATLGEAAARRVLLLRALEAGTEREPVPAALWSHEDRTWATRVACETTHPDAGDAAWLDARARHAAERLRPRDRAVAAALAGRAVPGGLALAVAAAALLAGLAADGLGTSAPRQIDLLSPALWGLLAWNALVYAWVAWQALRGGAGGGGLRRAIARGLAHAGTGRARAPSGTAAALARFAADWTLRCAPVHSARIGAALHLGAAALAGGYLAGLYLRGLVLDFRVGWQSTFLDAEQVRAMLATLLAPAAAWLGTPVPDVAALAALRVMPGQVAQGEAALWIHLFAATLALGVIGPRLALAAFALTRAAWRARRIELPLADAYFVRLLAEGRRRPAAVWVVPHGAAPSPQATLGLRALLGEALGEPLELGIAPVVAYGDEEGAPASAAGGAAAGARTLRLALFDLAATPEPEAQGRLVARLRESAGPLVLLVDEVAFARRFATLPQRLEERRASWRRFAETHGAGIAFVDLEGADRTAGVQAVQAALTVASSTPPPAAGAPTSALGPR